MIRIAFALAACAMIGAATLAAADEVDVLPRGSSTPRRTARRSTDEAGSVSRRSRPPRPIATAMAPATSSCPAPPPASRPAAISASTLQPLASPLAHSPPPPPLPARRADVGQGQPSGLAAAPCALPPTRRSTISCARPCSSADAGATVLYRKLESGLRAALADGLLAAGASLPGERELAEGLALSRATVRKALDSLVAEGFLVRRHGARTAVAGRIEKPLASLSSFTEDMRSRGLEPGVIWLHRGMGEASPAEVMALHLSPGATVCRLHRIRTGDGKPMAVERATVPSRFLPDAELVTASLYDALDAARLPPGPGAAAPPRRGRHAELARLLDLEPGRTAPGRRAPLLRRGRQRRRIHRNHLLRRALRFRRRVAPDRPKLRTSNIPVCHISARKPHCLLRTGPVMVRL